MSTLRSWTNREGLMNRSIQAGSVAAVLGGTWHEGRITQHLPVRKVHLGPVNELGWGGRERWKWKTASCFPELSSRYRCVRTFISFQVLICDKDVLAAAKTFKPDNVHVAPSS